jgi:hypothetical protein
VDDQSSDSPFAFPDTSPTAFSDVDQVAQANGSVQGQFDQQRSRSNYIQSVRKGASPRTGAVRSGLTGNG